MWAIVKFDKKKFDFFKRELRNKLGHNHILYSPKILINKYKNNKLIKKEFQFIVIQVCLDSWVILGVYIIYIASKRL